MGRAALFQLLSKCFYQNNVIFCTNLTKTFQRHILSCVSWIVAFIIKNIDIIILFACLVGWLDSNQLINLIYFGSIFHKRASSGLLYHASIKLLISATLFSLPTTLLKCFPFLIMLSSICLYTLCFHINMCTKAFDLQ